MRSAVTGGGSGVGRAIALKLAQQGWRVAILGRRGAVLQETRQLAGPAAAHVTAHVCDVGSAEAVTAAGRRILEDFGGVAVLVNAAGTNAPRRALAVLSLDDYREMIATNLNGAYYCVQAFLTAMRSRGSGVIINIVSVAGKQASPKAGPAYVMSKFGLAGLTRASTPRNAPPASAPARSFRTTSTPRCSTDGLSLRRRQRGPPCCARRTWPNARCSASIFRRT